MTTHGHKPRKPYTPPILELDLRREQKLSLRNEGQAWASRQSAISRHYNALKDLLKSDREMAKRLSQAGLSIDLIEQRINMPFDQFMRWADCGIRMRWSGVRKRWSVKKLLPKIKQPKSKKDSTEAEILPGTG
jgi:hypothetical protein